MAIGEQAERGAHDELLSFAPLADGNGVEIVDRIERRRCSVLTPQSIAIEESSVASFEFPVSRAVTFETRQLTIPNQFSAVLRNSLGFMIAEIMKGDSETFPNDRYSLDPGTPVKTYLRFESPCDVVISSDGIQIEFPTTTTVHLGARSHHKRPATTITTTEKPTDLMAAFSAFSSALKTTSCERSYPTLRGHPPTIEIGNRLDVPAILDQPKTGIHVQVPPDHRHVFSSATLAYYLGADIVPGDQPRVVTETGFEYDLRGQSGDFESTVERVLKQVFFLDCITRTEGLFQVNLHERNTIERHLDIDFAGLYDSPLSAQLKTYLEVPYDRIEPHLPTWKLTARVEPKARHAEIIPFLVNDLAVIRSASSGSAGEHTNEPMRVEDFVRGAADELDGHRDSGIESAETPSLVRVDDADSMEQTWVGDGAPIGASKALLEAFRNGLERTPATTDIDITVVCNAAEMSQEEDLVNQVYGSREELPFDVSIHRELTTRELETVLKEETEFFHYIGHIDAAGFECLDGRLDVATIDHTGVDVFFLNACTSYQQGRNLIEAGSIAGVVTLQDVINSGAERVGKMLARLLNWGFPLRPAMRLAKGESIMGGHYLVMGDGSVDIAQPRVGIQGLCDLSQEGDDWQVRFHSFPTRDANLGTIITPNLSSCDEFYLISGNTEPYPVGEEELIDYLEVEEMPVRYEGETMWSSEFLEEVF